MGFLYPADLAACPQIKRGSASVVHPHTIKEKAKSWIRIEGVFLWGRYGHKGNVMGMIDRITKIELLEKREQ